MPQAANAFIPASVQEAADAAKKKITLLEDGNFNRGAWGWQLTKGASIQDRAGRSKNHGALHVQTQSGDYARFLALGPQAGKTYTLSGWMKTKTIAPQEAGAGAYFAASQFEFQGRPTEFTVDGSQAVEKRYGNVTGTSGWTRFSQSFECLRSTAYFEIVTGIYRAAGEAWFTGITFVEGKEGAELAESLDLWEANALRHRALLRSSVQKPRAAILHDAFPIVGTASDPQTLRTNLEPQYEVQILSSSDLADPARFGRKQFDLLVLPCGESFPLAARGNVQDFLEDGGDLLTMGGYAFQSPVVQDAQGAWSFYKKAVEKESTANLLPVFEQWKASQAKQAKFARETLPRLGETVVASLSIEPRLWEQAADLSFSLPARGEGRQFYFEAWIETTDIVPAPDGCAFLAVEQVEEGGGLAYAARETFAEIRGSKKWQKISRIFYLTPTCTSLRVRFGLKNATGSVRCAMPRLEARSPQARINTALGWPEDSLTVTDHQIGMFDADYRLKQSTMLRSVHDATETTGHFEGYAASGVLGMDHARWLPILHAHDDAGRKRGVAGAMMLHSNGAFSRGTWTFFGVENRDLFAAENAAADHALQHALKRMENKCFLHAVQTNFATYRQGEEVLIRVLVSNFGRKAATLSFQKIVLDPTTNARIPVTNGHITLEAGETRPIVTKWNPPSFDADHYRLSVELMLGDAVLDSVDSGFNVWSSATLKKGMPLTFHENYFQVEGRSVFLQGTDDYLHTFVDQDENPATWRADAQGCRDSCIDVYENLMGLRGPQHRPTETWWRWIDALVLNTQSVGGVFFPGMLVFANTAVSNADLADQTAYVRAFAERYRDSAAIMYYLNGDLQLHDPNLPDLQKLYNDFLRTKYGTDAALKAAWVISPPEKPIGELAIHRGTANFADVRTMDDFQFRTSVVRRWLNAMHDAIREVDTKHPVTAEFYQSPVSGIDLLTAMGKLELANFGYFADKDLDYYRFPQTCRFLDQSMRGKGINVGEFGVKTHPAWDDTGYYIESRTEQYEQSYFLSLSHYAFALGASKIQNWCWKYPADLPFEWGINYPNDMVARDVRAFYRNSGLLFRSLRPRYEDPETIVLLASDSRMGGQGHRIVEGQLNCIRLLLDAHVRFGTLTDEFLSELPSTVKTIFYPLSYCPLDAIVARLTRFVEEGGQLYLSGDISYDSNRQRTKTQRLKDLCGVEFISERYAHMDYFHGAVETGHGQPGWPHYVAAPGIRVRVAGARTLLSTIDGDPTVTVYQLKKGRVVFNTDPIELHADPRYQSHGHALYSALIQTLNVPCEPIAPNETGLHVFRVPMQDDRKVIVVVNHSNSESGGSPGEITVEQAGIHLTSRMPGIVVRDGAGALQAVESSGTVTDRGRVLLESDLHLMMIAFGGQPLATCSRALLLPMGIGNLKLHRTRPFHSAVLLVGEMRDGKWHELRSAKPTQNGSSLGLRITAVESLAMLILCEEAERAAAVAEIETWVITPWKLETK
jgi:hypothetical protein